jgi:hypothetical protein
MKRPMILLFTFLSMMFTSQLQAQSTKIGLKGGLNISRFSTEDEFEPDGRTGFHAGVFMALQSSNNENLFLQLELLFSQQGYDFFKFSYINLPILAKYYPVERFSIHGGIQLGILVDAEFDAQEFFTEVDLGIPFGMEYDITEQLSLGLRYVLGVTNINDDEDDFRINNRVFQAFVAFNFKTN